MKTMTNPLESLSFLALFNAAADAMLLIDADGAIVQANDALQQMLGYAEKEVIGLKVESLMPHAHRKHHHHYRDKYFNQPEKRPMGDGKNLAALTSNGEEMSVDIGLSPIETDGKTFVLVTLYATDKQVLAEASLQASEERLRLAKLAAGLGVFDVDLKLKTVLCDEIVSRLWGVVLDEAVSYERFLEAIDAADYPTWQAALDAAAQQDTGDEYHLEFRVNNLSDKSQRWLFAAGKVFFKDHHAVRVLGVVRDITEHKLLTQKLSSQRIEMEYLAKQQVAIQTASAIAHEINQPLAAISAYSEVALFALKSDDLDIARLDRSLVGCVTQAQRAGKSLHELLAFLQKGEIAVAPINLNEIVQAALDITQNNGYGGFHSTLNLEPNLPEVMANHTQLQKVLVNLFRNGVEAVHSTGIPIAAINVSVRTLADSSMAQVTIQDNGPGLSDAVAKHIFEPFFTTKQKGIGMGLAISRTLIEANGGQLWFDPDSSGGATFHLTLPLVK